MDNKERLFPCPFCGGKDINIYKLMLVTWVAECMDCNTYVPAKGKDTKENAYRTWNTRAEVKPSCK